MITTALIYLAYAVLTVVLSPLWLASLAIDSVLSWTPVTTAIQDAIDLMWKIDQFFPVDTFLLIIYAMVLIEALILLFKFINWGYRKIPIIGR